MAEANVKAPGAYKGQPWTLFDSVVSESFLLGDTAHLAIGTQNPAINANGEMIFFSAGRTRGTVPNYCNMDQNAQVAFGVEIWQMYILVQIPMNCAQGDGKFIPDEESPSYPGDGYWLGIQPGCPPSAYKLGEAIIQYGVCQLMVGQEEQCFYPVHRFGAGGGEYHVGYNMASNGVPEGANVLVLPEPISIPRTQNLIGKIILPAEVRAMIGTPTAPGVGSPRAPYVYYYWDPDADPGEEPTMVELAEVPYLVQWGLQGRRVKQTQYGQIAQGPAGA
jgi:hypothetical protein